MTFQQKNKGKMKLYSELAEYYYEIEKPGRKFLQEIKFLDSIADIRP